MEFLEKLVVVYVILLHILMILVLECVNLVLQLLFLKQPIRLIVSQFILKKLFNFILDYSFLATFYSNASDINGSTITLCGL